MNAPNRPEPAETTLPAHRVAAAAQDAQDALQALAAALAECAETHSVRDVARITGLPPQTVHRWRTQPPGLARIAAVRQALHDAGCG